jgi:hypothetical protein
MKSHPPSVRQKFNIGNSKGSIAVYASSFRGEFKIRFIASKQPDAANSASPSSSESS